MEAQRWPVLVALLVLIRSLSAQTTPTSFDEAHQKALAENPPDVKFTLRFKDDKAEFHRGEIIRLELGFSSARAKTYTLDAATYDRSGRMEEESFFLDPANGTVDPLRRYFENGRGILGGLRSIPKLTEKPYLITLDLNEWRRFDKPGDYRLYVVSNRVTDESGPRKIRRLASNLVSFTILPENPAWSVQALQVALQTLDAKPSTDDIGRIKAPLRDTVRDASRVLRFLDTPEAAREMARRHGDREHPGNFDFMLGIMSSSHGTIALEELQRRIADPDEPISEEFMHLLTRLAFQLSRPESLLPFPDPNDAAEIAAWQERSRAHSLRHAAVTEKQWDILVAAYKHKRGKARVATLYALANRDWRTTGGQGFSLSADYATQLRAAFAELSPALQRNLLEYRWPMIKSPEMLPHLRSIVTADAVDRELRDVAARHFWELSPAEARPIFLQEITSRVPRLSVKTLSLLPDKTLPQVEISLASHLENQQKIHTNLDAVAELIERYATPAIAPRVKTVLISHHGSWACAPQAAMLAYFLRVEPAFAQNAIQKVLVSRETSCRHSLFSNIARLEWRPELEEITLAQISNPDVEIAIGAVSALGHYGSPRAEATLWKRFETWHAEWKDRADDLEYRQARPNPHQAQSRLESALLEALTKAPAWLSDAPKLQKIKTFVVSQNARQQVESLIGQWNRPFSISYWSLDPEEYTVTQYRLKSKDELKRKLAQFPKGTVFTWMPHRTQSGDDLRLEEELRNFLAPRGLKLEKPQPDNKLNKSPRSSRGLLFKTSVTFPNRIPFRWPSALSSPP